MLYLLHDFVEMKVLDWPASPESPTLLMPPGYRVLLFVIYYIFFENDIQIFPIANSNSTAEGCSTCLAKSNAIKRLQLFVI